MIHDKIEWRHENTHRYPYLGYFSGCVVLFYMPNAGTLLRLMDNAQNINATFLPVEKKHIPGNIGQYRDDWKESGFKIFTGEITLCNATT